MINDEMIISNTNVYGLENAVRVSKFPMATDTSILTDEITRTTKKLGSCKTGTGHDQFLEGIVVQFDLTFTIKAWTEIERYAFIDFISSQSTMHRIAKFELDEQYIKYVDPVMIERMHYLKNKYNETKDPEDYLRLLYSNPCGFRLTAGLSTNYRQLKTIVQQRRGHRLPEWKWFIEWAESLPHFKELVYGEEE